MFEPKCEPRRKECERTGHFLGQDGKMYRCECLRKGVQKDQLGMFYVDGMKDEKWFSPYVNESVVVTGTLDDFKKYSAPVLLGMKNRGKAFLAWDAYRLVDIFLEKDGEETNFWRAVEVDLFILLLGIAKIANKRLPEMVLHVLERREMNERPTWVWVGDDFSRAMLGMTDDVSVRLERLTKVRVQ